jgi:hypothetical protein
MRIFGNIKNRSQATEAYHFTSIVGQAITLSLPVAIAVTRLARDSSASMRLTIRSFIPK